MSSNISDKNIYQIMLCEIPKEQNPTAELIIKTAHIPLSGWYSAFLRYVKECNSSNLYIRTFTTSKLDNCS